MELEFGTKVPKFYLFKNKKEIPESFLKVKGHFHLMTFLKTLSFLTNPRKTINIVFLPPTFYKDNEIDEGLVKSETMTCYKFQEGIEYMNGLYKSNTLNFFNAFKFNLCEFILIKNKLFRRTMNPENKHKKQIEINT